MNALHVRVVLPFCKSRDAKWYTSGVGYDDTCVTFFGQGTRWSSHAATYKLQTISYNSHSLGMED
ncbi:hypothetical protein L484_000427 [Morus notabilis]|uniref:Uncharacterized protein n=1 Tax=Morus notabilis TaxID=981085 RepID=W9SLW9_9ROSA|nr:hypothetical protein L484_000427 [Morus notabilis]